MKTQNIWKQFACCQIILHSINNIKIVNFNAYKPKFFPPKIYINTKKGHLAVTAVIATHSLKIVQ